MTQSGSVSEFNSRLYDILDRVEYRRIVSAEDMEDVARLREKSFTAANLLPFLKEGLIDDLDFDPHAYVFGIYYDERLVSTVRIHHVTPAHRVSTCGKAFPEILDPMLDAGMTMIDPARLAADPEFLAEIPAIPYLTLRIATMATDYFEAHKCFAFVKVQHAAFYRRVFRAHQVVPPQPNWNSYNVDAVLMAVDVPAVLPKLYVRYPFFRSQPFERRMMFASPEELGTMPLTIRPTARYHPSA
ncbi:MAG: hypothetical protein GY789_12310 [Hyphomicrobiales bacterium]|nr:hypothetical protein [Hyphomicrobiales bacterium]MCP5000614.1 hypothetical protein [Hyphomicrobiales bacterium]